MTQTNSLRRSRRDDSGMTLVELMVAMTLLIVVITIGFVVTTTVVKVTYTTQRTGSLTGPAQNGMDTLQGFFSGAVPNQTITTPVGVSPNTAPLYANQCSASPPLSTSTDVWLCAVRSGSSTAYSYEIHFASCPAGNPLCTLQVTQQSGSQPVVAQIANVCVHCAAANTSFGFTPPTGDLSKISSVTITLTLGSPTSSVTANPASTTTLVRQVSLSNSLGGSL
ncbi:MAG TPA: prepilin-type N-terminal cleavage/methylation domain-containing protein [Acidimicrobiales bacterium]|jgi:hypothetical protein|nr:prepilin-type N-terminal cleavage/methylation domain-containing protein [Acidimicrobiales bacterium]